MLILVNEQATEILLDLKHNYSDEKFEIFKENLTREEQKEYYNLLFDFKSQLNDYIATFYNKVKFLNELEEDDKNRILHDLDQHNISKNKLESIDDYLQEKYKNYSANILLIQIQNLTDRLWLMIGE